MAVLMQVLKRVWTHPGNRGHRLRAIGRAFGWQIYKRLSRRPLRVEFVEGFSMLCFPGSGSASNIFYGNHYFDLDEMNLMRRVLRPGDAFIDGGANIGVYSMLAASLVGRDGNVVAFEPFPEHAARFEASVALNQFEQVELRREALSGAEGTVRFVTNRDVSNRIQTRTDADADTIEVPVTTLDRAVGKLPPFTVCKLDLEGSEIAALHGASGLLERGDPPMWIIEWNRGLLRKRGHVEMELINLLEKHGFRLVRVDGDRLVPAELPEKSGNIVAVRADRISFFELRLRECSQLRPTYWKMPQPVSWSPLQPSELAV